MPEIKTVMTADTSQFERAMKKAQGTAKSSAGSIQTGFKKVGTSFASIASKAGLVGAAIGTVTSALGAITGKNIDLARNSFEKLAASFNTSGEQLLAQMQKVSHGMIADFDLIQAASRAMVLGLRPDAIVSYLEIAAASSKATGQTMTEAFNDITIGVARQSRLILDNLGIIVSQSDAYEKYAQQIGVATSALTDNQKQIAFQTAVMEAGQRQIKILGSDTEDMFTNTAELITRVTNLWNSFATEAGKAFNVVAGGINKVLDGVSSLYHWISGTTGETKALAAELTNVNMPNEESRRRFLTTPLNGNGVQAKQDQAEIAKRQAKELDKMYEEISKVIDSHTKSDTQRIKEEYDKRLEAAQGNAELTKQVIQARDLELAAYEQTRKEAADELINQQRQELLTRREQELEELQDWYSQVMDIEGLTQDQRLEATKVFEERKLAIADEARQKDLESAKDIEEQKAELAKQEAESKKASLQRQTDLIQSFGTTALSIGKAFGEESFEMQKGLAAGQAIMDTHAAVMKTMASVPYPFNIPLAAAQAAIGAAEVAKILSATPDGGGDTSSAVGGGAAGGATAGTTVGEVTPTATTPEEKSGSYTINIMGDIMNEDYVDLLAEKISDAVQDRNVILKASQARTVRG